MFRWSSVSELELVAEYSDNMAFGTYRRTRHTYDKLLNGGKIQTPFKDSAIIFSFISKSLLKM